MPLVVCTSPITNGKLALHCALVLLLAILSRQANAYQEETPPPEQLFAAGLVELQTLIANERWGPAASLIPQLLEDHAGAEYAIPHLAGMGEELRRVSFLKDYKAPPIKKLIRGKLLSYKHKSNRIKVQYDRNSMEDFVRDGDAYVHPMSFLGDWSVSVSGTNQEIAGWTYLFERAPGDGFAMTFGQRTKDSGSWTMHNLERFSNGGRASQSTLTPQAQKTAKQKLKAKVAAKGDEFVVSYKGKRIVSRKVDSGRFERLRMIPTQGLSNASFGVVTIEGAIAPSWIEELLAKAMKSDRDSFNRVWREPRQFKAWDSIQRPTPKEFGFQELLDTVDLAIQFEDEKQRSAYLEIRETLGKGRFAGAATLIKLDEAPVDFVGESAREYLKFHLGLEIRYPNLALISFEKLDRAPNQELEHSLLRSELMIRAGRTELAAQSFERITAKNPTVAFGYERLADTLLLLGRTSEALEAVNRGREKLPFGKSLRSLEAGIRKILDGPDWERTYQATGRNFLVKTDVGGGAAKEVQRILDQAWRRCPEYFGELPSAPKSIQANPENPGGTYHSVAFLFAAQSNYLEFNSHLRDDSHEHRDGLYSTRSKQIAAWNQPDAVALANVLRQQVAHRYLDLLIGERIPRWLGEALAQYFAWELQAADDTSATTLVMGEMGAGLAGKELPTMYEVAMATDEEFMSDAPRNFSMAWGIVRLFHGGPDKPDSIIRELLAVLQTGQDPMLALDDWFGGLNLEKAEEVFAQFMKGVQLAYLLRPQTFKIR